MTGRELTSLAIRLFAIYVLVRAVLAIPALVQVLYGLGGQAYLTPDSAWFWGVGAFAVVLLVVLAVVLWRLATRFVGPAPAASGDGPSMTVDEPFVLSVLGLYLAFKGLLQIAFLAIGAYSALGPTGPLEHGLKAQTIAYMLGYLVQLLLGLTLILRSHGWAALLRRLREAGLKAKPSAGA